MTDPLATHTLFASALHSTEMPPLVTPKPSRNLTGILLIGSACVVGIGAIFHAREGRGWEAEKGRGRE